MTLATLVRHTVLDPVRSRAAYVLFGIFLVFFGAVGYLMGDAAGGLGLPRVTSEIMAGLAPLAALGFTYDAISGPRERGGLRVTLSYPYTRREFLLGTLVGRAIVVVAAVVFGALVGGVVAMVLGGTVDIGGLLLVTALSALLAGTMVAVAVGISASVASSTSAAVLAFAAYLLFSGFWGFIPGAVRWALAGFSPPTGPTPGWVPIWNQLSPVNAFRTASSALTGAPLSSAVYHAAWFGLLVLVGWIVLSTLVGLLRFGRTDL